MNLEAKLAEKNKIKSELQEAKEEVETNIREKIENNGISVCEVDSTSDSLEFTVTTDRMIERQQLQNLDSYFENFCCSAITPELDISDEKPVVKLFFTLDN